MTADRPRQTVGPARLLVWVEQSPGFVRSACKRFDVVYTTWRADWIAIDWDTGTKSRHATREAACGWCQLRANGGQGK